MENPFFPFLRHKKNMHDSFHLQKMKSLLESGEFSDVTLVVGHPEQNKKELKVHRLLLSAFSPVFAAMFSHTETKEALEKRVVIEDVSAEAMEQFLMYIYTGKYKFDIKENEKPLLEFLAVVDKVSKFVYYLQVLVIFLFF